MTFLGWIAVIVFIGVNTWAVSKRNTRVVMIAIASLGAFFYFAAPLREITEDAQTVTIKNIFGRQARLEKTKQVIPEEYRMAGPLEGPWALSGYSVKIPVTQPETGNQIIELRLVDVEKNTVTQIKAAFENAIKNREDVFLQIEGEALNLLENKLQGRAGDHSPASIQHNVLVKKIAVTSKKIP